MSLLLLSVLGWSKELHVHARNFIEKSYARGCKYFCIYEFFKWEYFIEDYYSSCYTPVLNCDLCYTFNDATIEYELIFPLNFS
jgi:hypothetical protein